jgi:hypothetical protein
MQNGLTERPEHGPVPDVFAAMLAGDVAMVRAWLAHPYIGSGNAMNAVAIFLSDRLEQANAQRDELLQELRFIAEARPSAWEPDVRDQFQPWAQNRACTAIRRAERASDVNRENAGPAEIDR